MEIKLSTNNHNILTSGIVFTHERSSDINIEVKADNGFSFTVVLKFSENNIKERDLKKEIIGNTIVFNCINFDSFGAGTTTPISLATVGGKEWFMHFWAYQMGDMGPRKVEYTILEKE